MPLEFVNVKGPQILVFVTGGKASTEEVHHIAIDNRSVMADGFWLLFSLGLHEVPAAGLVLLIWMVIEVLEGIHIDHPEVVEETFTDIMSTKNVELILIFKS